MTLAANPIGSAGGTHLANYTYDEGEQRIAKASGSDLIHYHYDDEGRLIAESDGHTGATLRDYVWLGLTPIAVIATAEVTNETGPCDEELITALEAELAAANSAADVIEAEVADQQATAQFQQDKVDEMYAQLDTVSGNRRDALERRIERWEDKIATLDSQIELLTLDLADIYNQIGQIETALTEARNNCDGGGGPTLEAGTYYLHADHLGKPQFATDSTGATVWDGGITTPFGEGVVLAGAFAQNLMFPGQYADLETAANNNTPLFHNWHRTYDPTLGRYLQSDPIGLAGGINRYAYVGGNPVSYVDPTGLNPGIDRRADSMAEIAHGSAQRSILKHLYRNCYNIDLPVDPTDADRRGWKAKPDWLNAYHRNDVNFPGDREGNKKWVSSDGRREVIFTEQGLPDFSPQNAGTYNYGRNFVSHYCLDMLTYYEHGNGPVIPTDCECAKLK